MEETLSKICKRWVSTTGRPGGEANKRGGLQNQGSEGAENVTHFFEPFMAVRSIL